MNRKRLIPISLVLILALLACGLPTAAAPTQDQGAIYTAAAQTIAAQVGQPPASTTEPPPPPPANTEAPPQPQPTSTHTPVPSATSICDKTQFVSETIPDGTVFAPGATFVKTWRVRNVGNCTWTAAYAIVFDSGNHLGAPDAIPFPGNVAPGQEVDLSINMQAPAAPGNYESYWKFRNASGIIFVTNPYSAKITVVAPTATATVGLFIPFIPIPLVPLLLPTTQQVFNQVTISAGATGQSTASCPSGSVVVGGGFAAGNNMVVYTHSMEGNGWRAYVKNNSVTDQLFNAYAVCLYNTSGTTSQVWAQVTAAAGGIGHAVATCPAGSVATGGGYASNPNLWVYNSSMSGNGWEAYAKNTTGSDQLLNAYAICLSGTTGATTQIGDQITIAGNSSDGEAVACPAGIATGGGFALSNNLVIYNSSMAGDVTKWNAYARNTAAASQLMNIYAVCLSFP
jgi:hypothetical protein